MTKKKRKSSKNRRNFVAIPFEGIISLGALASNTVIKSSMLSTSFGEDFFAISADILCSVRDKVALENPLIMGVAHNDLTVAEIAEALAAEVFSPDAYIEKERARRPVRRFGIFAREEQDAGLNDGKLLRFPIKFSIGNGHT